MEPAEAQECTFAPEIHEMTMLYVGMSWWSSKNEYWFAVTLGGTNSLWSTSWELDFFSSPRGLSVLKIGMTLQEPTLVTSYDPIKKIWFSFELLKYFCRHSFRRAFWSCTFFWYSNPALTILWDVSLSMITQIAKHHHE
jgi:hypothetical protein